MLTIRPTITVAVLPRWDYRIHLEEARYIELLSAYCAA